MIIVGEKINTSRPGMGEAVEQRNRALIVRTALDQAQAGADYIDVNAGTFPKDEAVHLCWLVETVQSELDLPLCLDSPNPEALSEGMKRHNGAPMINSISLEEDRFKAVLPIVASQPCEVVALCMGRASMPTTVEDRVEVGKELVAKLMEAGISAERIYVDPLIQPVSVDVQMGIAALGAIREIMKAFPGVKTICGLSNVSYGLPERRLINRSFLALAMSYGLSAAILDPMDRRLMGTLLAVDMLLGRDEYCEKFIEAYQEGRIVEA
ncbi:MAG: dihydropteroate synthase [Desulfomonilaceae bacterium]|nr:dihydropteroate synthase [Desulfomonilaceae bacterium]